MNVLASCGDDGLRVWGGDGFDYKPLVPGGAATSSPSLPHAAPSTVVRWYPSGRLLCTGTRSGKAVFYQDSLAHLSEFDHSSSSPSVEGGSNGTQTESVLTCLDISSGSRYLATGLQDGTLAVWDMKTRTVEVKFKEDMAITGVSIQRTTESRYVACSSGSGVSLYSRASGRLVNRFTVELPGTSLGSGGPLHTGTKVTAVGFSPHMKNVLVAADSSGSITAWDISRIKPSNARPSADGSEPPSTQVFARFSTLGSVPATDIAFATSPKPFSFVVSGLDKKLRFFSLEARKLMYAITCTAPLTSVALDQGSVVAAGTTTGSILLYRYDLENRAKDHEFVSEISAAHSAIAVASHPTASSAVRSLHFQPVSAQSRGGVTNVGSAHRAQSSTPLSESDRNVGHGISFPPGGFTKATSSPSVSVDSMGTTPASSVDVGSSAEQSVPRESDIFSPVPVGKRTISHMDSSADREQSSGAEQNNSHADANPGIVSKERSIQASRTSDFIPRKAENAVGWTENGQGDSGVSKARGGGVIEPATFSSNLQPTGSLSAAQVSDFVSQGLDHFETEVESENGKAHAVLASGGTDAASTSLAKNMDPAFSRGEHAIDEMRRARSVDEVARSEHSVELEYAPGSIRHGVTVSRSVEDGLLGSARSSASPRAGAPQPKLDTFSSLREGTSSGTPYLTRGAPLKGDTPRRSGPLRLPRGNLAKSAPEIDQSGLKPPRPPRSMSEELSLIVPEPVDEDMAMSSSRNGDTMDTPHGTLPHEGSASRVEDGVPSTKDGSEENPTPTSVVGNDSIHLFLREEFEELRHDIRRELVSFHRELVLSFSKQEDFMRQLIDERDKRLEVLEKELNELRVENRQLRKVDSTVTIPEWMSSGE